MKVRIIRPNPTTAVSMGYTKGRILDVTEEVGAAWIRTKYAEPVMEGRESAMISGTNKAAMGHAKGRKKRT